MLNSHITQFQRLRIDRTHGIAPHKPILLISILQAFQNGIITTSRIYLTPELVGLFKSNWAMLVTTNHNSNISYPFYYLRSSKFWKLIPKPGFDNIDEMGFVMKSFSTLNAVVDYALISEDLFLLVEDKITNEILQKVLLDTYFPLTKQEFTNSVNAQKNLFNEIEKKDTS